MRNDGSSRASTTQVVTCSPRRRSKTFPKAPTVQTAEILLDQAQGALRAEIARLADLVETDALGGAGRSGRPHRARDHRASHSCFADGRLSSRDVPTWVRAACSTRSARSSPRDRRRVPGTTRDVVAFQTAIGGWPVELADTAGLCATANAIEQLGMERTRQELGAADLVVLVLDRSEELRSIDRQLMEATLVAALVIANKL